MHLGVHSLVTGLLLAAGALVGCAAEQPATRSETPARAALPSPGPAEARTPVARPAPRAAEPNLVVSDGQPRRATVSIPRIALRHLVVVPYRGFTDDQPGTDIQNGGRAASPHGPRGGVGPGGVGNYQVTAHRTSSTRAFERLPGLRAGDRVFVVAGGVEYVYEIVRTRQTSFRSAASLRAQRAAVPGNPGREPTQAMITLSTCATPEDHAAGNYWSDRFGNPEHRIDKIGRLVRSRPIE
jgi:sortase A